MSVFRNFSLAALTLVCMGPALAAEGGMAAKVTALERAALSRWVQGDPGGFLAISAPDVVYFDPMIDQRIDGLKALKAYYRAVKKRGTAKPFDMQNVKVQPLGDAGAVLTYHYVSGGKSRPGLRWNCTEVYRRDPAGWRIIQTHWSYTNLQKMWDAKVQALKKDMAKK